MSLIGHDRRRRAARRRLVLVAVGVVVVVAAGITAAAIGLWSGADSTDSAPHTTASASASSSRGGSTGAPSAAPANVVLLPAPGRVVGGVPMGFPHTLQGAVSAASHYYEVLDLFDPSAAGQQAKVIAQPGFEVAMGLQAQHAAQDVRKAAGLAVDGTSDQGNYFAQQARAFRVVSSTPDRVAVWLLMDDTTSAKGVVNNTTAVQGSVMVWAHGDWRLAVLQQLHDAPQPVTPGTPEARQEGWQELAYQQK